MTWRPEMKVHGLLESLILNWRCYWTISIILSWLSGACAIYPELSAEFTVCELNSQTAWIQHVCSAFPNSVILITDPGYSWFAKLLWACLDFSECGSDLLKLLCWLDIQKSPPKSRKYPKSTWAHFYTEKIELA